MAPTSDTPPTRDNTPTTSAGSGTNPCRYGHLYGLQTLGTSLTAVGQLRRHKARSGTTTPVATLGDYYLYTAPRTAFERALCGKKTTVPVTPATHTQAEDPTTVTLISPVPATNLEDVADPTSLGDYLAHLHATDPEDGITGFLQRNTHPAARAVITATLREAGAEPGGDLTKAAIQTAATYTAPVTTRAETRAFYNNEILATLSRAWKLSDIEDAGGRLDLGYEDTDARTGAETGVAALEVTRRGSGRALRFTASLRPGATQQPAVVLAHKRGITEVVPLEAPREPASTKDMAGDWAEAIPVVGNAARAVVSSAYHFGAQTSPAPAKLEGRSETAADDIVAFNLEAAAYTEFGTALEEADRMAAQAGLDTTSRRHLRSRLITDSTTGVRRWAYRSHIAAEILELAQHAELGLRAPAPPTPPRGTAHADLIAAAAEAQSREPAKTREAAKTTETVSQEEPDTVVDLTDDSPLHSSAGREETGAEGETDESPAVQALSEDRARTDDRIRAMVGILARLRSTSPAQAPAAVETSEEPTAREKALHS